MGTKRITLSIYEGIQGLRSKYQTNPKLDTLDKNNSVRINNNTDSSNDINKEHIQDNNKRTTIPKVPNG